MPKQQISEVAVPDELEPVDVVIQEPARDTSPDEAIRTAEIDNREQAAEAAQAEATTRMFGAADINYVVERFQGGLYNYIYHMIGNRDHAADLLQDVWVKVWKAFGGTEIHEQALSSWLYRIASNTATDALRRRRLITWIPLSLFLDDRMIGGNADYAPDGSTSGSSKHAGADTGMSTAFGRHNDGQFEEQIAEHEVIDAVLARMKSKRVVPLLLYHRDGFSASQIAEALGISPSAVKMQLMRAREQFKVLYRQEVTKSSPSRALAKADSTAAPAPAPASTPARRRATPMPIAPPDGSPFRSMSQLTAGLTELAEDLF